MARRSLLSLLVVLLVLAFVPIAGASGVASEPKVETAGVGVLEANTAPADAYELAGDDTMNVGARNITSLLPRWDADTPGWGIAPYTESHTIDTAMVANWDEDWVRLDVSAADMADWSQLSYRVDAFSLEEGVDLVLDVYAAGATPAQADTIAGADMANAIASNDDSAWCSGISYASNGRWSSVTFIPPAPNSYYIRVRPYYSGFVDGFEGHAGTYTLRVKVGQVERLAGADRVATAIKTSQEGWPTYGEESVDTTVVLAYSKNYPDALAASSLAGACGAPILLTPGDHLPSNVAAEIKRIGARGVYIVGGTGVIDNAVIEDLQVFLNPSRIKRIAGVDRYATAIEVLKETKKVLEGQGSTMPKVAFLVSGKNFPDALAVGPIAYWDEVPVLLTPPTYLRANVGSAIAMYGINDVIVAGGTGAVSADVVGSLIDDGMPPNRILRLAGHDRYETAKEIAAWACDLKGPGARADGRIGTTNNTIALASMINSSRNVFAAGASFPDALAGGSFAGKIGAPILLTPKYVGTPYLFGADGEIPLGSTQWYTDLAVNSRLPIRESYILGGSAAVTDDVFVEIDNNTGATSP